MSVDVEVGHRAPGGLTPAPREELPDARPFAALRLSGRRVLLVASSGGHLEELLAVADLAEVSDDSLVVTFDTPQAAHLHTLRKVEFVPAVAPRDLVGALRVLPRFRALVATGDWDAVLSTGAAVGVSALVAAASSGVRALYVESYARLHGPSTSGRILRHVPGVETYTQHRSWAGGRWGYAGSVRAALAARRPAPAPVATDRPLRILVTLGTIRPYRFDALVDAVLRAMPADAEVTWQLGSTTRDDLPGEVHGVLPHDAFVRAAERADLVVSHGGVGTAMALAQLGKPTVLVPRRAARGEHVDDHQVQICAELVDTGAVLHREADALTSDDLLSTVYVW